MQVPLRPVTVSAARHLARPGTPVHAYGVCTAAESVHSRPASRMLRCPACGALHAHLQLAGLPLPACCAEGAGSAAAWEEDVTGRISVPVRPTSAPSLCQSNSIASYRLSCSMRTCSLKKGHDYTHTCADALLWASCAECMTECHQPC